MILILIVDFGIVKKSKIMSMKSLDIVGLLHWHYFFFMLVYFYATNVLNIADNFKYLYFNIYKLFFYKDY